MDLPAASNYSLGGKIRRLDFPELSSVWLGERGVLAVKNPSPRNSPPLPGFDRWADVAIFPPLIHNPFIP
jgi:hypothetical protein